MKKLLGVLWVALTVSTFSEAADRRPMSAVNTDELTTDTQVSARGAGDNHVAIVWWIPHEFWKGIMARDTTTSASNKKAMLQTMEGVSLLAVAQADITQFGTFNFYAKQEVENVMSMQFTDADGEQHTISPMQSIDSDLNTLLGAFKPILAGAMGNLGSNMHFYVLDDTRSASGRLIDPYRSGELQVQLRKRDRTELDAVIETPINALFVPRKCPNGKDAHISWTFCPWSGTKLAQ